MKNIFSTIRKAQVHTRIVKELAANLAISEANHLISKGSYDKALALVTPHNVNDLAENGSGLLHSAVQYSFPAIRYLITNYGANPNLQDEKNGDTPLHVGAEYKKYAAVESLLSCGARPNLHNYHGYMPLHKAAEKANILSSMSLIKSGASIDAARIWHSAFETPLYVAVDHGNHDFALFLASVGATINPKILANVRSHHADLDQSFGHILKVDEYCANNSIETCLDKVRRFVHDDGVICARILVNVKTKLLTEGREISKQEIKKIIDVLPSYNLFTKLQSAHPYDLTELALEISNSELFGHVHEYTDYNGA